MSLNRRSVWPAFNMTRFWSIWAERSQYVSDARRQTNTLMWPRCYSNMSESPHPDVNHRRIKTHVGPGEGLTYFPQTIQTRSFLPVCYNWKRVPSLFWAAQTQIIFPDIFPTYMLFIDIFLIPGGRAAGTAASPWGRDSPGSYELAVWRAWSSISLPGPTPRPRFHGDRTRITPGRRRTRNWGQMESCRRG